LHKGPREKTGGDLLNTVLTSLALVCAFIFAWLVLARTYKRLIGGSPCPSSMAWILDNPLRRRLVGTILDRTGVQPGEVVLELGPGPGTLTREAAKRVVPDGKVIAVDIQPAMIAILKRKVTQAGLVNVETCAADGCHLPLKAQSVDRAFLVTVLPEIPDRQQALAELCSVLKPTGTLSITEQFLDPDYPLSRTTIRWVEAAGFKLTERHGNWWNYTLNFRRA
jgi:ubiquinone/menaquinone biosynthesis C-methylase UbiE